MEKRKTNTGIVKQFIIQTKLDNIPLDFLLFVSQRGEVLSVKPMIYELPEIAQKLILGDTDRVLFDRKIKAYCGQIPFILRLLINGRLQSHREPFLEVMEYVNQSDYRNDILEGYWTLIESMIVNINRKRSNVLIFNLNCKYPAIAVEFLPTIIPFLNENDTTTAFIGIGRGPVDHLKDYLCQELEYPFSDPYSHWILIALKEITPSEDIYETVLRFYKRERDNPESVVNSVLTFFQQYPREYTKQLGFEILKQHKEDYVLSAAKLLVVTFREQKEVVKIMMPHFLSADPINGRTALSVLSYFDFSELLPNAEVLLSAYVKLLINCSDANVNSNIGYTTQFFADKNNIVLLYDEIYELLHHEVTVVKQGVLAMLQYHDFNARDKYSPYKSTRFVDRYIELLQDEDHLLRSMASEVILQVGYCKKNKHYIKLILKKITDKEGDVNFQRDLMIAINNLLFNTRYQPQIESFYLKALKSTDPHMRIAALNGLRFSKKKNFVKILEDHLNDSSKEVKNTVSNFISNKQFLAKKMKFKPTQLSEEDVFYLSNPNLKLSNKKETIFSKIAAFFSR